MNITYTSRALMAVAMAALLVLPMRASAQDIERTFDADSGDRLELRLKSGGDIVIRGWDRSEISVKGFFEGRDADELDIEFRESSAGLTIRTESNNRRRNRRGSINLEIMVPSRFDIELETMGGDVTLDGVEGTFEGQTMGGDLELVNLKGSVSLQTMGGDIFVESSDLDGKVHTMGGEVRVEDVGGSLDATTMGGQVRYANSRASSLRSRSGSDAVRIKTMGGAINVDDAPAGADVHTMGGDIKVESAGGYVKAHTMGGEITIEQVNGWVEATTMGGDIDVTMVGDPDDGDRHIELSSMGGDVELTVPAGLSMDIDVELTYTRRARERYRIVSDFMLEVEEDDRWYGDDGEDRKTIYATGIVSGGRHRIKINTVNGNVTIKKGR